MKTRQVYIPILPKGSKDIKVLHFSDLHLRKKPKKLLNSLKKINFAEISFVVVTGDFLSSEKGIEIFLENFQGPLDLLLYLIRKQNLNVLDIPMAPLTRQYMAYVDAMRQPGIKQRLAIALHRYLMMMAIDDETDLALRAKL